MKELKEAQMGIITVLALMLVSIKRRLPTRELSSGITTLALAGIVLLVAAGSASANGVCEYTENGGGYYVGGDTVMYSCTFNASMTCPVGHGLIIGADGITIDGAGYAIIGDRTNCPNCGEGNPQAGYTGILNYNATLTRGHDDVVIKDLEIKNFCNGIVIKGKGQESYDTPTDNNTIVECSVHDNGDDAVGKATHGIHLWRATNTMVKDCAVYNNTGYYTDSCGTGGHGIRLYGNTDNCTVEECNIYNNTHSGIFAKYKCDNCTIAYNKVTDNGVGKGYTGGIRLMCKGSNDWLVEKNNVTDSIGPGIFVRGSNCLVRYNTVTGSVNATGDSGCRGNGIFVHSDAGNTEIYNNTFCDNEFKDIHNTGPGTVADSNTCDKSNLAGACDWSCGVDNAYLRSVYFDFDGDGQCSKKWEDCPCALPGGAKCACCLPGLFNGSADAKASYEASCNCQWTPGPDPNDSDPSIMGIVKPDLIVANKSEAWFNETHYNVSYRVQNIGNDISNESVACVCINTVLQTGSNKTIGELASGAYSTVQTVGPFGPCTNEDTIVVCADCDGNNTEWNESNNCLENKLPKNKPDLIIVNKSETWFDQGAGIYNITYMVKNIGTATTPHAQGSRTKVLIDNSPTGTPGVVPILAPGEEFIQTLPYGITVSDDFDKIELCADGPNWIAESNESNNCLVNWFYKNELKIYVDPPSLNITPQDQFDINITVDPAGIAVYGVEYYLTYNTSVLRAESQVKGPFLGTTGETIVVVNEIDRGAGIVSYAETRKDSASGVITENISSVIQFTAIGAATDCTDLTLSGVIIVNTTGGSVLAIIEHGTVCLTNNQAPVAAGCTKHLHNNVQKKFECLAQLCSNSTDPDAGDPDGGGEIVYIRWSFGDGEYGTSEGLGTCPCKLHSYTSWIWEPFGDPSGGYVPFNASLTVTDNGDPQLEDTTYFNVSVYLAGDANADGTVNILDAVLIGLTWDDECKDPTACCELLWADEMADKADLNNDCKINILDAVIVGTMWDHNAYYPV